MSGKVLVAYASVMGGTAGIAEAIGDEGPHRWLTIDFTADPRWL